jgi:hypothetical protein|tara:strand:- start:202 stop:399 length:198 start_codon:yes stop_codon:yes gene_type:complete
MSATELLEKDITCPFCWELILILVEPSEAQTYTEDCSVCCHPILIRTEIFGEDLIVSATQEDEGF